MSRAFKTESDGSAEVARVKNYITPSGLQRLKDDVVLYRLALGQPRQEDLLDLLRRQGVQADPARASALRLDLSPPTNPGALT